MRFHTGQIVRVKVLNFTTYADGEFHCAPSLNLIIGPNGTGKLTLVAAICLGLAGRPELISRKDMKLMIRAGESLAVVEIELKDVPQNVIIKREFTARSLTWYINGVQKPEKAVAEKVASFNIQLNNLCHFLPQERVAEFAGMNLQKLLEETQRTLTDGHLLGWHQKLIEMDDQMHLDKDLLEKYLAKQEQIEGERVRFMEQKEAYEHYQDMQKQADIHRNLLPFVTKYEIEHRLVEVERECEEAEAAYYEHEQELEPVKQMVRRAEVKLESAREKRNTRNTQHKLAFETYEKQIGEIEDKIATLKLEVEQLEKKAMESGRKLKQKQLERQKVAVALEQLEMVPVLEMEIIKSQREHLHSEQSDIKFQLDELQEKTEELERKHRSYKLLHRNLEQKLAKPDTLNRLDPNGNGGDYARAQFKLRALAYKAHDKLRKLKADGKNVPMYWEAPVVSCTVKDSAYALYVELAIDNATMFSITVDNEATGREIERLLGKDINAPIRVVSKRATPQTLKQLVSSLGFDGVVSDFIEGPAEVISMLLSTCFIQMIPVRRREMLEDEINRITNNPDLYAQGIRRFMENKSQYSISKSSYGNKNTWYSTDPTKEALYFTGGSGLTSEAISENKRRQRDLENKIDELLPQMSDLRKKMQPMKTALDKKTNEMKELATKREQFVTQNKNYEKVQIKLQGIEKYIEVLEQESRTDTSEQIENHQVKLAQQMSKLAAVRAKAASALAQQSQELISHKFHEFKFIDASSRLRNLQSLMKEVDLIGAETKKAYEDICAKLEKLKSSETALKNEGDIQEFESRASVEDKQWVQTLIGEYQEAGIFNENYIVEKISTLEEELVTLQSSADRLAVENYHKKLAEAEELRRKIPELERNIARNQEAISGLRPRWELELRKLVEQISNEFHTRFTKEVASDGQVELAAAERLRDYELRILTKFRPEMPLKVLDHQSQSGGERAVATIFFIMSLQGLTEAPFRVVDEINQGMDPTNERAAHRNLVQTASISPRLQYFLVTPKLLTGLYYSEDMAVHCIYASDLKMLQPRLDVGDFLDFRNLV